ncbi:MAG: sulfotransferase domain-containing protein [Planctomycetia bacterium]|nr:sulfotransferase domain-containing protein [Planctomycetia bacterium]
MITVVSGLPRSGTSLVMQMLQAGGHPILCDECRPADPDNPCGYLEYAKVRTLERDATWLAEADGRAVKVVSPLLPSLPTGFDYRVIFVRRDLSEIIRSQEIMLQRRNQPAGPDSAMMTIHFERHLKSIDEWLASRPDMQVLNCQHATLIGDPASAARKIAQFLQRSLDVIQMAAVVDPVLYRQQASAG